MATNSPLTQRCPYSSLGSDKTCKQQKAVAEGKGGSTHRICRISAAKRVKATKVEREREREEEKENERFTAAKDRDALR